MFRYRKPSLKTVTGITRAKKRIRKASGITAATKPLRAKTNLERRLKRKAGYYSKPAKLLRNKKPPTPLGCVLTLAIPILIISVLILSLVTV